MITPGPWASDFDDGAFVVRGYDNGDDYEGHVAEVRMVTTEDMAVICAAPDMLDVCHLVLATATIETPKELIELARDAIRKAENGP